MMPATIDFRCRTNADYSEELQFEDSVPIDLTNLTFRMQARHYPGGPLAFEVPIGVLDAVNGTVSIGIPYITLKQAYENATGSQLGGIVKLSHDIIVTHADGFVEPWAQGVLMIEVGVTQNG